MPSLKYLSKRNKELLSAQNAVLAEEYSCGGAWAHKSSVPKVGGLVCRMPLEAEIYCRHPVARSMLRGRLRSFLQSEEYSGANNQRMLLPTNLRSLTFTEEMAAALLSMSTSIGIRLVEVPGDVNIADLPSFSALASRTVF